ncbi:TetR/AcrR family transcriptional regulator [Kineococcus sp. SYSU DK002]|uniref:TetR/AcrR family transcriptional regulator n=1 Tax=Kineococcus sp. SYSU DK002 TaxID=3383123 RepID=UPI003D7D7D65
MPKLVDHAERRDRIIRAAWRIIAERGIDAATMREIAREAGYANGALTHYFADKDSLLRAAYEYVYAATNQRVAVSVHGLTGVEALRAFCREVLPLDDLTVDEARVVLAVWSRMTVDADLLDVHAASMRAWRDDIVRWLGEGRALGRVRSGTADEVLADHLITLLMGAQVLVLSGDVAGPSAQEQLLEEWLGRLGRP